MRTGDILAILLVAIITFPILYVGMMLVTGSLRLEYGFKEKDPSMAIKVEEIRHNARRDSLAAQNSKAFQAAEQERAGLVKEQERVADQYKRLEILQGEIEAQQGEIAKQREELAKERAQFESSKAAALKTDDPSIKKLAQIYEAMKPAEAAGILETLPDAQVGAILSKMSDNRQKGKILALLSTEKTARINKLIK